MYVSSGDGTNASISLMAGFRHLKTTNRIVMMDM
jgi:hypothetical protein